MKWLALAVAALVGGAHGAAVREAASEFRVKVSLLLRPLLAVVWSVRRAPAAARSLWFSRRLFVRPPAARFSRARGVWGPEEDAGNNSGGSAAQLHSLLHH
jgi:hypothetical protein